MKKVFAAALIMLLTPVASYGASVQASATPTYRDFVRQMGGYGDVNPVLLDASNQTLLDSIEAIRMPVVEQVIFCGENAENGTIYFAPAAGPFGGDGSDISIGSVGCDALDNATEATADAPLFTNVNFKVMGFWCKTDGTLGADESIVFTLRSDEGNLTNSLSCTVDVGETDCRAIAATPNVVAGASTVAMSVVQTSDNADDNAWCRVTIALE